MSEDHVFTVYIAMGEPDGKFYAFYDEPNGTRMIWPAWDTAEEAREEARRVMKIAQQHFAVNGYATGNVVELGGSMTAQAPPEKL